MSNCCYFCRCWCYWFLEKTMESIFMWIKKVNFDFTLFGTFPNAQKWPLKSILLLEKMRTKNCCQKPSVNELVNFIEFVVFESFQNTVDWLLTISNFIKMHCVLCMLRLMGDCVLGEVLKMFSYFMIWRGITCWNCYNDSMERAIVETILSNDRMWMMQTFRLN